MNATEVDQAVINPSETRGDHNTTNAGQFQPGCKPGPGRPLKQFDSVPIEDVLASLDLDLPNADPLDADAKAERLQELSKQLPKHERTVSRLRGELAGLLSDFQKSIEPMRNELGSACLDLRLAKSAELHIQLGLHDPPPTHAEDLQLRYSAAEKALSKCQEEYDRCPEPDFSIDATTLMIEDPDAFYLREHWQRLKENLRRLRKEFSGVTSEFEGYAMSSHPNGSRVMVHR